MQEVKEKKDSLMVVDNKKEIANISVPNEGTSESKKIGNNKTRDVLIFILILAFIVLFITIISTIFGVINNQNNKIINGVKINGIAVSSIEQASELFDEVVIAVMQNPMKKNSLFTVDERMEIIKKLYSFQI